MSLLKRLKNDQELKELYHKPKRENHINTPQFINAKEPNDIHQADILFFTEDVDRAGTVFKYILTVIDCATRKVEAEPVSKKKASTILKAFKRIYNRGILSVPKRLEVDDGGEFKGECAQWFREQGTYIRYGLPGRSRQQGLIEKFNQRLGTDLWQLQVLEEKETGEDNSEWLKNIRKIIQEYNAKRHIPNYEKLNKALPRAQGDANILIPVGTNVRRQLDKPQTYHGDKLQGKFRKADIKFSPTTTKVDDILMYPSKPPMYLLQEPKNIPYTKGQLQIVKNKSHKNHRILR